MVAEGFTEQETALIRNMMVSRDAKYIATLLDSDPSKIKDALLQLSDLTGIISRQQQIDEQRALKKKEKPPKVALTGKTGSTGVMSKDEFIAMQKKQAAAPMPKKLPKSKKAAILKQEAKKQDRIIRVNQNEASRVQRERARGPLFKTKEVDYSRKHTVRIDDKSFIGGKTFIYVKPGENEEEAKANFKKLYKHLFRTQEVSPDIKTKHCRRCKKDKPVRQFKIARDSTTNRRSDTCDECIDELDKIAKKQKKLK